MVNLENLHHVKLGTTTSVFPLKYGILIPYAAEVWLYIWNKRQHQLHGALVQAAEEENGQKMEGTITTVISMKHICSLFNKQA